MSEPQPIESGYEEPLYAEQDQPTPSAPRETRGPMSEEARRSMSEAARRRWSRDRIENRRAKRPRSVPEDAEVVEDEHGREWYEWTGDDGEPRRRKVRSDRGASRPATRRPRVPSVSLAEMVQTQEAVEAEEEREARREYWEELAAEYREQNDLPPGARVSRGALRNFLRVKRCGGIPRDGVCPVCRHEVGAKRRQWVARQVERRMVCKSCHLKLGDEQRAARRDAMRDGDKLRKMELLVELMRRLVKRDIT